MELRRFGGRRYFDAMDSKTLVAFVLTAFVAVGCVTTEEEFSTSGAHLGDEVPFAAADTDKSGALSKKEVSLYHHREVVAQFDLDRDNHISATEWETAHPTAAQRDVRFNQLDRDGNKRVSEAEAAPWVVEHVSFGDSFKKYDLDGDSSLHWKELEEAAPSELKLTVFSIPLG